MVSTTCRLVEDPVATVIFTGPDAPLQVKVKGVPSVTVKSVLVKAGSAEAPATRATTIAETDTFILKL